MSINQLFDNLPLFITKGYLPKKLITFRPTFNWKKNTLLNGYEKK